MVKNPLEEVGLAENMCKRAEVTILYVETFEHALLVGIRYLVGNLSGRWKMCQGCGLHSCRQSSAEFIEINRGLLLRRNTEVISEQREKFRGLRQIFLMIRQRAAFLTHQKILHASLSPIVLDVCINILGVFEHEANGEQRLELKPKHGERIHRFGIIGSEVLQKPSYGAMCVEERFKYVGYLMSVLRLVAGNVALKSIGRLGYATVHEFVQQHTTNGLPDRVVVRVLESNVPYCFPRHRLALV